MKDSEKQFDYTTKVATDKEELYKLTLETLLKRQDEYGKKLLAELRLDKNRLKGSDGIRKKLGAIDLEYFGRAYFPHYFFRPSPGFHRELDDIWHKGVLKEINPYFTRDAKLINKRDGVKRALAAPRGHAKSTNLTFKDDLHAVLYAYKNYILILSDTYDQAASFVTAIRGELEENAAIIEDFGNLTGKISREDVLVTSTGIKIQAKGAGQKVRGLKHKNWRPDLIMLDDIENDENVRTPEQRKKLENWFYKAVSKTGDTYTDIIYIGTLLHYGSLLAKVMRNPSYKSKKYRAVLKFSHSSVWQEWEKIFTDLSNDEREMEADKFFETHRDEMLEDTQVLWAEKNSYYDLMKVKVSEGEAAFNSEMQNDPINPDDCLFNEEWFEYYNPYELDFSKSKYRFFGFVDPSLGKSKNSDYSAIITLAKDMDSGYMYVVYADIMRRHPDAIIDDILNTAKYIKQKFKKDYDKFGAETNQFQWFLKEELAKKSARKGIYLPIEEVRQTSDKLLRIQSLQPDIKNKYIQFNKSHKLLLEQLKYFPMGAHDDGPDALEACRSIAQNSDKRLRLADIRLFNL